MHVGHISPVSNVFLAKLKLQVSIRKDIVKFSLLHKCMLLLVNSQTDTFLKKTALELRTITQAGGEKAH